MPDPSIAQKEYHGPDVTVAMLLFIIVVVTMQEFCPYYWCHLEAMYRQLKAQPSNAPQNH